MITDDERRQIEQGCVRDLREGAASGKGKQEGVYQ